MFGKVCITNCLSTSAARWALAALVGAGTVSAALPACAVDVANETQLRAAITGGENTITFTANITLTSDLPPVASNVTINGGNFTLSGNNQHRGLLVQSGTVAVNDLTIADARAQGGNGGGGGTGGGGGAGLGAALFVASGANVTVSNVNLQGNEARGGNGGPGGQAIAGGGGGGMSGNGGPAVDGTPGPGGDGGGGRGGGPVGPGDPGGFGGGGGGAGVFASNLGGQSGFGGGGGGGFNSSGGTGEMGGGNGSFGSTSTPGRGGGGAGLGGAIFVQQGGNLTMSGGLGIVNNTAAGGDAGGPGAQAGRGIGSGLFLHGNGSIALAPGAGQTQTISDTIADQTGIVGSGGSWSLVKNGAGTTVLTGANAYSGGVNVNAGILQGNAASLKSNIANNAAVVFEQTGDGTYAGNMSGSGTLTKTGAGLLVLTGTSSYSGGTTVSAGTLFGDVASLQGNITNNASVLFDQKGNGTYAGIMSGSGTLTKANAGILTLTGNNTYLGGTTVREGTLQGTTSSLLGTIANFGTVVFDQAGNGTYAGSMSGTGTLFKRGAGEVELTGINTYTGGTQVAGGILRVASDDNLGAAGRRLNLQDNGALRASETFTSARAIGLLGTGGGFQVDAGKILTLSGSITGDGSLTKGDDGTLILTGDNEKYNGDMRINGGTLQGNGLSFTQRGNIVFDSTPGNPSPRSVVFDIPEEFGSDNFRGNIEGAGSLTKTGTARLDLLGDNSYTGGTTVLAGELRGNSRSLQGAIANSATLTFNQGFDGTYAGSMTGGGQLIKNGTGQLTLTDISSVGGGTTINAGAMAVNGSLVSPTIDVKQGAILKGTGTITGTVTGPGDFKPGSSIGTITVDGNLTMDKGTIEIEVNANGASDRINIIGAGHKANLKASTLSVVAEAGTYTPNTRYTIVTAPAGGIANFGSLSGGVGFLTPTLRFDATNLYLSMVLPANAFRSAGQTANQQAVGGALDVTAAGGSVGGLVTAMANLPTSQGAAALQALSGQPYADFGTVNLRGSQLFMNAIGRQMAVERGAGLGGAKSVALAEACADACDTGTPSRFAAWLSGIGSTGSVLGDGNAAGLTYTLGGTAFGIDYRLDPRFLFGIAGGYVGGTQWVNGFSGTGNIDALSVALYGSFTQGGFYADALAGYANARNRMQRVVAVPGLATGLTNGDTSANQFLGQIETGYKFGLGFPAKTSITPFGRVQVGSSTQAGFSESGSTFYNLAFQSQTTTSVRTTFGADFAASFDLGGGRPLDIGVRLGWLHEFADTARPITAAFAAAPGQPFTVVGATPQRDSAVVGFSAAMPISDRASLFASYDGEVGGGTANHAGRVGFRLTW